MFFFITAGLYDNQALKQERALQVEKLAEMRAQLEGAFNGAINLTAGLVAFVATTGDIEQAMFQAISAELLQQDTVIRNITLAPDNVIRYVYPLEGNEAALGLDILNHPQQGAATRLLMETGLPVLAGPHQLAQGGMGVIHRVPVLIDEPDGSQRYWGLMSTPIDFERLIHSAGIESPANLLDVALRGVDGSGKDGAIFYGDPTIFNDPDAIYSQVRVLNGEWQIAARPSVESTGKHLWLVMLLQATGVLLALISTLFVWHIGRQTYRLESSERLYRELSEHIQDVVFQTNNKQRITYLNPAWEHLTGYTVSSRLGIDWRDLLDPDDRERAHEQNTSLIDSNRSNGARPLQEFRIGCADGSFLWVVVRASEHHDANGQVMGMIGTMIDITSRKASEDVIRHMAEHDSLTGLPNRTQFYDRFNVADLKARRNNQRMALLYMDLDGFKPINDQYGHTTGDEVLKIVAQRFRSEIRGSDSVVRIGGDEFVILLENIATEDDATVVADKVIQAIKEPIEYQGKICEIGVSIGIALYPEHGASLDKLLMAGDAAMYQAKASGKSSWCFYAAESHAET
ncbi:sensor domain-containing diguanylate cyclase [Nitrincola sp. MINF-07-Sa-05]|uniref:sensor domain-containing diguanylate cyclase n=1 Tax=Nitrincola salilacus TaxID=3400273 RepID=UPI003917C2C5